MKAILTTLYASLVLASAFANAADNAPLADRHAKRGVACASCHAKSPSVAPTMKECLACHGGSYEALAKKTDESDINPHATHMGEPECSECHSGHKQPRLVCDNCHEFTDIKVP